MSKDELTPLPIKQFIVLLTVRFMEPVSFTLLFPFVYFMVRDFNITNSPKEIGYYVGYIASAFAISQLLTSVLWGHLSDKIGRRPVIIFGLMGSSISLFLFGLSKSLAWAVTTRAMCGLLNGNIGIIKSMVTELTDDTNRAKGFSYLPLVFCMGSIFGPLLGGYLSNPVEKYPMIFGNSQLFKEYPYFLPCLICSCLCFFGAVFALLCLKETSNKHCVESQKTTIDRPIISCGGLDSPNPEKVKSSKVSVNISNQTRMILFGTLILSFTTTFTDELIPLWTASSPNLGGLGFDTSSIGNLMSITGISSMVLQFLLYPTLQRKFGTSNVYKASCFVFLPVFVCYPLARDVFANSKLGLWTVLVLCSIFRLSASMFSFTGINILLAESSGRSILGIVNGMDVSARATSRAIAPIICGSLYSWSLTNGLSYPFDFHFNWYLAALTSVCNFLLAGLINTRVSK